MQLGLFSVSYAGYWGQQALSLEDFIRRAAQLGFDCVMLAGKRPHLAPVDMTEKRLENLQKVLQEANIQCAVVAAYTDLCLPAPAEVPHLEWQIHYVSELGRWGARLGAKYVRVFTGYSSGPLSPQAQWVQVVRTLQEMADRLAEHQMTLAVQNHHDLAVHTDALLELLSDVDRPNCKLAFDAWSPFLRGESLYEAARKAAPHTAITTNADYIRLPRFAYDPSVVNYRRVEPDFVRAVPFGQGQIPFEEFFRGLRDGGFDGVASYEMCSPIRGGGSLENLDTYARTYLDWMRQHALCR
ncbi:MAG: sugar phosphate isomerase/epimerase [Thermoguttaceae bacterium]|nr:sugar phosphate isomerase/epimerase [Thermoguttaceae bacterium]MDW8037996.1 sugar phosphate isomerase/epimerase family protein [Thermoguttaceae bacterium]